MASWGEIAASEPDFARRVQKRFDAYKHKVIATLRSDGSPRISGIEADFAEGRVSLGMMPGSLKARDCSAIRGSPSIVGPRILPRNRHRAR